MPLVFEGYRGYDISDKIQAIKLDDGNIKEFYDLLVKELSNSPVTIRESFGHQKVEWCIGLVKYMARPGDYVINDPVDGYLAIAGHVFEKSFARDI